MSSFADLDDIYGSKSEALEAMQSGGLKHIRTWLWAGLTHEDESLTVEDVGSLIGNLSPEELVQMQSKILTAASKNLPQAKDDGVLEKQPSPEAIEQGWDWTWMYYIGTTVLRMSENDFWRCTMRRFYALWDMHVKMNTLETEEGKVPKSSPELDAYIDRYI
ncbi:hypothetical protein [Paenibacillus sp. JJ-100]|uniref:hypothetical protein n=1 Tax=Paenibacillus sp. JJ-100 TaxID=2974896 RepID=UPI00232E0DFB|nr:hypothetical protein [Paenibacillus sp. JJ-100]